MKEKMFVAILVAVAVILVGFLGALFYISGELVPESTWRTEPEEEKSGGTDIMIYENGMALVNSEKRIDPANPMLILPDNAVMSSLRVNDSRILGFREAAGELSGIRVETDDESYTGNLLRESEDFMVIETTEDTMAINKNRINRYYLYSDDRGVELICNATAPFEAETSFFVTGMGWAMSYDVDLDMGVMEARATVDSSLTLDRVDLALAAGTPRMLQQQKGFADYFQAGARTLNVVPAAPAVSEGGTFGEYYVYEIENVHFEEGKTLVINVFSSHVDLDEFYYWRDGPVERRVTIRNTAFLPFVSGKISFLSEGRWVGDDMLAFLPEGDESEQVVGYSSDVSVEKNLTTTRSEKDRNVYEYELSLDNDKDEKVRIVVEQFLNKDTNVLKVSSGGMVEGNRIRWEVDLGPGKDGVLSYSYEKLRSL